MFLSVLQNAGIAARLAILSIEGRKLDTDKLNEPVVRDKNSGIDRVLMIMDRR